MTTTTTKLESKLRDKAVVYLRSLKGDKTTI